MNFLSGYKTYLTAAAAVLGAVAAFASGTIDAGTALNTIVTAVLAATVRNGIANS